MNKKQDTITFKVDQALAGILRGIPNRSDFIRKAILAALENVCPLCAGTGILTPEQRTHFKTFSQNHTVQECTKCHAVHFVCAVHGHEVQRRVTC